MPSTVRLTLDSHIWLPLDSILEEEADVIVDDLTIENEDKIDKLRRNIHDADELPDEFILVDLVDDKLKIPRGYLSSLIVNLRGWDYRVVIDDRRMWLYGDGLGSPEYEWAGADLRIHQPLAVRKMRAYHHGIYVAPTGSGKTVSVIRTLCELQPHKAIIQVGRSDLVDQWIDAIVEFTTLNKNDIGRIDGTEWSEGVITVATSQSIRSMLRRGEIDQDWFDSWSFAKLDECHWVTADTINDTMQRYSARYRGGTSATPSKTGHFKLATTALGPIIHEDDEEVLVEAGIIMQPEVHIVETGHDPVFWGDHQVDDDEPCNVPGCRKSGKVAHGHRNNYSKVLHALVRDQKRNLLIAEKIHQQSGVQIVLSAQTNHLDALRKVMERYYEWDCPIYVLTGKQKGKKRADIIRTIKAGGDCIILTTVGGEGLDIPIINRVHIIFPLKNVGTIMQFIGRGRRVAAGKKDLIVFDYADRAKVFRAQLRQRIQKLYVKKGWKIIK